MPHALTNLIRQQLDERGWRNQDLVDRSHLSRAHVSKLVNDGRDRLSRLPDRVTIEGLAKAFGVPATVVLAKAVEALDLGFEAEDFDVPIRELSDEDLLAEVARRLGSRAPVVDQAEALITDNLHDLDGAELAIAAIPMSKAQKIEVGQLLASYRAAAGDQLQDRRRRRGQSTTDGTRDQSASESTADEVEDQSTAARTGELQDKQVEQKRDREIHAPQDGDPGDMEPR